MRVVADIPEEFDGLLEEFREHFGTAAFEPFKRYLVALIPDKNLTAERIIRVAIRLRDPSNLSRFLTNAVLLWLLTSSFRQLRQAVTTYIVVAMRITRIPLRGMIHERN